MMEGGFKALAEWYHTFYGKQLYMVPREPHGPVIEVITTDPDYVVRAGNNPVGPRVAELFEERDWARAPSQVRAFLNRRERNGQRRPGAARQLAEIARAEGRSPLELPLWGTAGGENPPAPAALPRASELLEEG
jgi:hypothetical protein